VRQPGLVAASGTESSLMSQVQDPPQMSWQLKAKS